jgi:DNA end-binding protein Ku
MAEQRPGVSRPIWRGHLRLALVSCPIALYTARRASSDLHFHFINPATGHRVRMVTTDAESGEELQRRDLVRGFEFKKDTYVLLDDEDFERARIDSSTVLNIAKFVDAATIDPIYFDGSYYVGPDGDSAADVFVVLQAAMAKSRRAALSRVVIARREHAVALVPMGRGLVAHALLEQRDLADPKGIFDAIPRLDPEPDMLKLAAELIERRSGRFEPSDMEDRYEARLREVIEAKLQGEGESIAPEAAPEADNVIDLMAALKRSLGQSTGTTKTGTTKKAPARKAPAGKSAPARKAAARKNPGRPVRKSA